MRVPIAAFILMALLGQSLQAQKKPAPPAATIEYDRIRDRTTVTFERFTFGGDVPMGYGVSSKELGLMVTYESAGHSDVMPDSVTLRFVAISLYPYWQLRDDHDLHLLLGDSTRVHLIAAKYDTSVVAKNTFENVYFRIPRQLLLTMASASTIEGALADKRFIFLPEQRAALLAFVRSRIGP